MEKNKNSKIYLIIIILSALICFLFIFNPTASFIRAKFHIPVKKWKLGLDLAGGARLTYQIDLSSIPQRERKASVDGLRSVIEKRINIFGVNEPEIYIAKTAGVYRLIVELPAIKDISAAIKQIGQTPLLDFREVKVSKNKKGENEYQFIKTNLNGRYIKGASLGSGSYSLKPEVDIEFNREGAKIFEKITGDNVGKPLAIFLDNQLIEMPRVQEKISGGKARITGIDSIEEAKKLVERFNAGALPAPIKLVSQEKIGPSLGQDSLNKVIKAGLIGFLLVILYMLFYYKKLGLCADGALIIYLIFLLTIYKLFSLPLSLSSIGGIILSIGMAVDANVLIFERIKEEFKKGIVENVAIISGFKRAWPSIRDANTTTILVALILFYFTSSFVKGFGLSLVLGVLLSMFSAIVVTRLFLSVVYKKIKN